MPTPGTFFAPLTIFGGVTAITSTSFVYGTPAGATAGTGYDMGECNWLSVLVSMGISSGTAQFKVEWSTGSSSSGTWFPESFRDYNNVMGTAVAADADGIGADVPVFPIYHHFPATGTNLRSFLFPAKANFYRIGVKAGSGSFTPTIITQRLVL